jgi:tRNA threonylcarbamoyl adenosine modification protein YeaZ
VTGGTGGASERPWLLVLDTATSRVVVAAGELDGGPIGERAFPAEHHHGERLLATIDELSRALDLGLGGLRGIVVGTGPGAFTGLRVGLATAKTLAHELRVPIVGVSTGEALLAAVADGTVVALPAGPNDRVEVRRGEAPRRIPGGTNEQRAPGDVAVAVDLDGRADPAEADRGRHALEGLAASLLELGRARLAAGSDDPERLVPEYVSLPRGAGEGLDLEAGMAWSRDHR